jgi:MFS family permease
MDESPFGEAPDQTAAVIAALQAERRDDLPRAVRALRNRNFRLFWTGNFLSNIGTWMQNIALGWLVLKLTNSPFWLGMVGFSSSVPILLFALIGGVIADHVNKRKLMMVMQSVMMVLAFIMSALAFFNVITVKEIVLLALGTGIAMSLNTPSYQALVPQLVPKEDLTNAIAINSAQYNMSRVLGPTIGGFAMALVHESGNFFLNGLSFLAVIIALSRIRYIEPPIARADLLSPRSILHARVSGIPQPGAGGVPQPRVEGTPQPSIGSIPHPRVANILQPRPGGIRAPRVGGIWKKMQQGFAYVFRNPSMSTLVVLVGIASLCAIPYLTFIPYFARDILGTDEAGLGLLMACSGAGALLGALTIASIALIRRRGVFIMRAAIGFFVSIILFTFSRNFYLSGFFLMIAGYCMIVSVATINSSLQHLAENSMRGRVMSIYSTAFLGLPPLGCLIAGLLTRVISTPHAIAGMTAVGLIGSLAVYYGREGLRQLD